ncbi:MAG: hypothetical protein B6U72_04075 [Candidatus Altiarchaeales archaeon ex4484_2]|nr:MAG: hypothetical protein B6U72_04075 [Candidatus Altiarchaeales archaeon ex4484_2]
MKKDVNLILFGLVVFLLFSMVGITLYYQETYKSLDESHAQAMGKMMETEYQLNETITEVEKKSKELDNRENELIDIINELDLSKKKVSSLGDYYENLRGEKETLENQLDSAESNRDRYKLNLDEKTKELEVCEKDKKLIQSELGDAEKTISTAKGKVGNMSSIAYSLWVDLDEIESIIDDDIRDDLDDIRDDIEKGKPVDEGDVDRVSDSVYEVYDKIGASKNLLRIINTIISRLNTILS